MPEDGNEPGWGQMLTLACRVHTEGLLQTAVQLPHLLQSRAGELVPVGCQNGLDLLAELWDELWMCRQIVKSGRRQLYGPKSREVSATNAFVSVIEVV